MNDDLEITKERAIKIRNQIESLQSELDFIRYVITCLGHDHPLHSKDDAAVYQATMARHGSLAARNDLMFVYNYLGRYITHDYDGLMMPGPCNGDFLEEDGNV